MAERMTINRTTQPEGERMALKPCPFCRMEPTPEFHANGVKSYWQIVCARSSHTVRTTSDFGGTEQQAIDRWNTRKTSRGGKA